MERMATFFRKPEVQYKPPKEDGDIEIAEFLRSCDGIVEFISFLGAAFIPVKNDISGNIAKIRRVYETDSVQYATVRKLLDFDSANASGKMGVATDALLWLKRSLEFIFVFLEYLARDHRSEQPSDTLVGAAQSAYEKTLTRHHNFIQHGVFAVIIRATPWKSDFLKMMAFGRSGAEDECIADLEQYLVPMKCNVDALMDIYYQRGIENYDSKNSYNS